MDSSPGIRRRKLIRIRLGRSEQKRFYVLHKNRLSGQTMSSTTSIRPVKETCPDYVGKNAEVCNT